MALRIALIFLVAVALTGCAHDRDERVALATLDRLTVAAARGDYIEARKHIAPEFRDWLQSSGDVEGSTDSFIQGLGYLRPVNVRSVNSGDTAAIDVLRYGFLGDITEVTANMDYSPANGWQLVSFAPEIREVREGAVD
jgi:hypothetical protein